MRYEPIGPVTPAEAERATTAADPAELARVILALALHADFHRAAAFGERFAGHPDPGVRGAAMLGFGHLARRFGTVAPRVIALIEAGLTDPDPWVRGQAEAAADDVEYFTRSPVRRPG